MVFTAETLNGQGTSSVLDSIIYALAGARSMPDEPLRRGAKTGHIRLDLGALIVARFLNPHGSSLEIRTRDGYRADSPQAFLDTLVSNYPYDLARHIGRE